MELYRFYSSKLYVEQSAVTTSHGINIQNELKTKTSRREIPLPNFVIQALTEYKRWQEFYRIKNTGLFVDKGYVIANQYGNIRHSSSFLITYLRKFYCHELVFQKKYAFMILDTLMLHGFYQMV